MKRIAIVFLPGLGSFIGHIADHFRATGYDVKVVDTGKTQDYYNAIEWCDVLWIEWCNELAYEILTKTPPHTKRVIVRLHSYECFAGFPARIGQSLNPIDDLIFVAPHIRDHVTEDVPNIDALVERIHVIPNGIDTDKFGLIDRAKNWSSFPVGDKPESINMAATIREAQPDRQRNNIAYVGYINHKKGPELLLQAFESIVASNVGAGYQLHIAGTFQDPIFKVYYEQFFKASNLINLKANVRYYGWQNNILAWLSRADYIINTSVIEACPVGIMQAMATGSKPLIHAFYGARRMFPVEWIWRSMSDLVELLNTDHDPEEYRQFVIDNYSERLQLERIDNLIKGGTNHDHRPFPKNE